MLTGLGHQAIAPRLGKSESTIRRLDAMHEPAVTQGPFALGHCGHHSR